MTLSTVRRGALYASAAFGIATLLVVPLSLHSRLAHALADASSARSTLVAALDTVAQERTAADSTRRLAARAIAARDSAELRADSLARRATDRHLTYAVAAATAPDTCRVVVALADSTIATQDSVITTQRSALQSAQEAQTHLQTALDTTSAALGRLQAAARPAVIALAQIAHVASPSLLHRVLSALTPRIGVGAAMGFDSYGKPNTVAGLTLGWGF